MDDKTMNEGYPIQGAPGPQKDMMPEFINGTTDPKSTPQYYEHDGHVTCEVKVAEADTVTKNGNIYPKEVLGDAVDSGGYALAQSGVKFTDATYNDPTFEWWQNEHGTWNATATFTSTDGTDVQRLDVPLVHYEVVDGGVEYKAEVDFNGQTYISAPFFQVLADKDEGEEVKLGRGDTKPMGAYFPNPVDPEAEIPTSDENTSEKPDAPDKSQEPQKAIEDENDPLNDVSQVQLNRLLKQVGDMVKIMENNWMASRRDFQLTDAHMKALYKFNNDHAEPMPKDLSKEEQDKWDHFNGLDKLTEEDVEQIFGKEHPIIGIEHTVTMDRIKTVVGDYFSWHYAMNEYKQVHDAYVKLIETEEERNIQVLRDRAAAEEDPEKKKKMEDAIELYYHRKYLGFLADEMDEQTKKRLATAWKDARKIEYWMKRCREKLTRMKISNQVIFEISDFEHRFLEEKYHRIYNMLLLYFMNIVTYCRPDEHADPNRNMAVCMVFGLDSVIRKTATQEVTDKIMNNVRGFLDQMLDYMKEEEN